MIPALTTILTMLASIPLALIFGPSGVLAFHLRGIPLPIKLALLVLVDGATQAIMPIAASGILLACVPVAVAVGLKRR